MCFKKLLYINNCTENDSKENPLSLVYIMHNRTHTPHWLSYALPWIGQVQVASGPLAPVSNTCYYLLL